MTWAWDRRSMVPALGAAAALSATLWLVGGPSAEEPKPTPAGKSIPASAPAPVAAPAAKPAPAPSPVATSPRPVLRPSASPVGDKPLAAPAILPTPQAAPPAPAGAPTAPQAPFTPYTGTVTRSDVYLRSGPAQNYYPTGKVQIGDTLSVVGEKIGWLEIKPPAGQFSWIDSRYVKCDAGNLGRAVITGDNVRVRAGSLLLPVSKDSVQTRLSKGAVVEVIGEADGFAKVRPPEGATLWISGEFVAKPGAAVPAVPAVPAPAEPKKADASLPQPLPAGPAEAALPQPLPAEPTPMPVPVPLPTPLPVADVKPGPADSPTAPINELESLYIAMTAELRKPVDKQDLDGLLARLRALRTAAGNNDKLREYCDYYLADLTRRRSLQAAFVEAERLRGQFEQDLERSRAGRRPASPPARASTIGTAATAARTTVTDAPAKPVPAERPAPVDRPALPKPAPTLPPAPPPGPKLEETTGYLLESSYWETYKDTLDGAVRYRLVQAPYPDDIYIIWVQAADKGMDLTKHLGKKVTLRGTKVYLERHRSHLLLVEEAAEK